VLDRGYGYVRELWTCEVRRTPLLGSRVNRLRCSEKEVYKINAEGLKREGDSYVNDAYGESEVALRVDV
jgi:hypothetical protein